MNETKVALVCKLKLKHRSTYRYYHQLAGKGTSAHCNIASLFCSSLWGIRLELCKHHSFSIVEELKHSTSGDLTPARQGQSANSC